MNRGRFKPFLAALVAATCLLAGIVETSASYHSDTTSPADDTTPAPSSPSSTPSSSTARFTPDPTLVAEDAFNYIADFKGTDVQISTLPNDAGTFNYTDEGVIIGKEGSSGNGRTILTFTISTESPVKACALTEEAETLSSVNYYYFMMFLLNSDGTRGTSVLASNIAFGDANGDASNGLLCYEQTLLPGKYGLSIMFYMSAQEGSTFTVKEAGVKVGSSVTAKFLTQKMYAYSNFATDPVTNFDFDVSYEMETIPSTTGISYSFQGSTPIYDKFTSFAKVTSSVASVDAHVCFTVSDIQTANEWYFSAYNPATFAEIKSATFTGSSTECETLTVASTFSANGVWYVILSMVTTPNVCVDASCSITVTSMSIEYDATKANFEVGVQTSPLPALVETPVDLTMGQQPYPVAYPTYGCKDNAQPSASSNGFLFESAASGTYCVMKLAEISGTRQIGACVTLTTGSGNTGAFRIFSSLNQLEANPSHSEDFTSVTSAEYCLDVQDFSSSVTKFVFVRVIGGMSVTISGMKISSSEGSTVTYPQIAPPPSPPSPAPPPPPPPLPPLSISRQVVSLSDIEDSTTLASSALNTPPITGNDHMTTPLRKYGSGVAIEFEESPGYTNAILLAKLYHGSYDVPVKVCITYTKIEGTGAAALWMCPFSGDTLVNFDVSRMISSTQMESGSYLTHCFEDNLYVPNPYAIFLKITPGSYPMKMMVSEVDITFNQFINVSWIGGLTPSDYIGSQYPPPPSPSPPPADVPSPSPPPSVVPQSPPSSTTPPEDSAPTCPSDMSACSPVTFSRPLSVSGNFVANKTIDARGHVSASSGMTVTGHMKHVAPSLHAKHLGVYTSNTFPSRGYGGIDGMDGSMGFLGTSGDAATKLGGYYYHVTIDESKEEDGVVASVFGISAANPDRLHSSFEMRGPVKKMTSKSSATLYRNTIRPYRRRGDDGYYNGEDDKQTYRTLVFQIIDGDGNIVFRSGGFDIGQTIGFKSVFEIFGSVSILPGAYTLRWFRPTDDQLVKNGFLDNHEIGFYMGHAVKDTVARNESYNVGKQGWDEPQIPGLSTMYRSLKWPLSLPKTGTQNISTPCPIAGMEAYPIIKGETCSPGNISWDYKDFTFTLSDNDGNIEPAHVYEDTELTGSGKLTFELPTTISGFDPSTYAETYTPAFSIIKIEAGAQTKVFDGTYHTFMHEHPSGMSLPVGAYKMRLYETDPVKSFKGWGFAKLVYEYVGSQPSCATETSPIVSTECLGAFKREMTLEAGEREQTVTLGETVHKAVRTLAGFTEEAFELTLTPGSETGLAADPLYAPPDAVLMFPKVTVDGKRYINTYIEQVRGTMMATRISLVDSGMRKRDQSTYGDHVAKHYSSLAIGKVFGQTSDGDMLSVLDEVAAELVSPAFMGSLIMEDYVSGRSFNLQSPMASYSTADMIELKNALKGKGIDVQCAVERFSLPPLSESMHFSVDVRHLDVASPVNQGLSKLTFKDTGFAVLDGVEFYASYYAPEGTVKAPGGTTLSSSSLFTVNVDMPVFHFGESKTLSVDVSVSNIEGDAIETFQLKATVPSGYYGLAQMNEMLHERLRESDPKRSRHIGFLIAAGEDLCETDGRTVCPNIDPHRVSKGLAESLHDRLVIRACSERSSGTSGCETSNPSRPPIRTNVMVSYPTAAVIKMTVSGNLTQKLGYTDGEELEAVAAGHGVLNAQTRPVPSLRRDADTDDEWFTAALAEKIHGASAGFLVSHHGVDFSSYRSFLDSIAYMRARSTLETHGGHLNSLMLTVGAFATDTLYSVPHQLVFPNRMVPGYLTARTEKLRPYASEFTDTQTNSFVDMDTNLGYGVQLGGKIRTGTAGGVDVSNLNLPVMPSLDRLMSPVNQRAFEIIDFQGILETASIFSPFPISVVESLYANSDWARRYSNSGKALTLDFTVPQATSMDGKAKKLCTESWDNLALGFPISSEYNSQTMSSSGGPDRCAYSFSMDEDEFLAMHNNGAPSYFGSYDSSFAKPAGELVYESEFTISRGSSSTPSEKLYGWTSCDEPVYDADPMTVKLKVYTQSDNPNKAFMEVRMFRKGSVEEMGISRFPSDATFSDVVQDSSNLVLYASMGPWMNGAHKNRNAWNVAGVDDATMASSNSQEKLVFNNDRDVTRGYGHTGFRTRTPYKREYTDSSVSLKRNTSGLFLESFKLYPQEHKAKEFTKNNNLNVVSETTRSSISSGRSVLSEVTVTISEPPNEISESMEEERERRTQKVLGQPERCNYFQYYRGPDTSSGYPTDSDLYYSIQYTINGSYILKQAHAYGVSAAELASFGIIPSGASVTTTYRDTYKQETAGHMNGDSYGQRHYFHPNATEIHVTLMISGASPFRYMDSTSGFLVVPCGKEPILLKYQAEGNIDRGMLTQDSRKGEGSYSGFYTIGLTSEAETIENYETKFTTDLGNGVYGPLVSNADEYVMKQCFFPTQLEIKMYDDGTQAITASTKSSELNSIAFHSSWLSLEEGRCNSTSRTSLNATQAKNLVQSKNSELTDDEYKKLNTCFRLHEKIADTVSSVERFPYESPLTVHPGADSFHRTIPRLVCETKVSLDMKVVNIHFEKTGKDVLSHDMDGMLVKNFIDAGCKRSGPWTETNSYPAGLKWMADLSPEEESDTPQTHPNVVVFFGQQTSSQYNTQLNAVCLTRGSTGTFTAAEMLLPLYYSLWLNYGLNIFTMPTADQSLETSIIDSTIGSLNATTSATLPSGSTERTIRSPIFLGSYGKSPVRMREIDTIQEGSSKKILHLPLTGSMGTDGPSLFASAVRTGSQASGYPNTPRSENEKKGQYQALISDVIKAMKQKSPRGVIVDLRSNSGGLDFDLQLFGTRETAGTSGITDLDFIANGLNPIIKTTINTTHEFFEQKSQYSEKEFELFRKSILKQGISVQANVSSFESENTYGAFGEHTTPLLEDGVTPLSGSSGDELNVVFLCNENTHSAAENIIRNQLTKTYKAADGTKKYDEHTNMFLVGNLGPDVFYQNTEASSAQGEADASVRYRTHANVAGSSFDEVSSMRSYAHNIGKNHYSHGANSPGKRMITRDDFDVLLGEMSTDILLQSIGYTRNSLKASSDLCSLVTKECLNRLAMLPVAAPGESVKYTDPATWRDFALEHAIEVASFGSSKVDRMNSGKDMRWVSPPPPPSPPPSP